MNSLDLFAILEMAKKNNISNEQIADLLKATSTTESTAESTTESTTESTAESTAESTTESITTIDDLILSKSDKFVNALNTQIEYIKVDGYNVLSFAGLHGVTISDLGEMGYKRSVTEVLEKFSVNQYACRWVNSKGATRHYCYLIEQIKSLRAKDPVFKSEMDQHIRITKTAKPKKELQDLKITW